MLGMHLFVINIVRGDVGLSRPIKIQYNDDKVRKKQLWQVLFNCSDCRRNAIKMDILQLQNVCLGWR